MREDMTGRFNILYIFVVINEITLIQNIEVPLPCFASVVLSWLASAAIAQCCMLLQTCGSSLPRSYTWVYWTARTVAPELTQCRGSLRSRVPLSSREFERTIAMLMRQRTQLTICPKGRSHFSASCDAILLSALLASHPGTPSTE